MPAMTFTKIRAGWYATPDGTYAVISDGLPAGNNWQTDTPQDQRHAENSFQGGEWAAVYDHQGRMRDDASLGENLDWFPTKRAAVHFADYHARTN